jgi:enamine deaminase RidA (YjgF/YER057c/UK114 family)
MTTSRIPSESRFAPMIGFSKAVRRGDHVYLAGMTAVDRNGQVVGGPDPYQQTVECLRKVEDALTDCGATLADVVQTRMYLVAAEHWQEVGRAHGEAFAAHPPAATMVVVQALLDPRMLVELEAVAVVESGPH